MRYAMLLKPHSNVRYRHSLEKLAMIELSCILNAWKIPASPELLPLGGEPFLVFSAPAFTARQWSEISANAGCCFAAEWREDGALVPMVRTGRSYYPEELSELMKYKGKTNADFTRLLLHCTRAVSQYAHCDGPLTILDPMCGKGTTLFCALEEGDHAVGIDVDAKALREADQLLGRSLKLNRFKHKREESSLTVPHGTPVRGVSYRLSSSPENRKAGNELTFRLLNGDLKVLPSVMPRESCHLAVADLPYGVQHAPSDGKKVASLERFASQVCESCFAVLKHGGAIALSFNTYTLNRRAVLAAMQAAGFLPLDEAPYNGFAHWVEQAVDRDAVLAVKP